MNAPREPAELAEDERARLHRAHQRLRNSSQALEALTAVEPMPRRWAANPAPREALMAASADLQAACQELWRTQLELLDLQPPPGASTRE